jgi:hypothetical protein
MKGTFNFSATELLQPLKHCQLNNWKQLMEPITENILVIMKIFEAQLMAKINAYET